MKTNCTLTSDGCKILYCKSWNESQCTEPYIDQEGNPSCKFVTGSIKEETSRRCENCDRYFDIETMHFDEDNIGLCEECYNYLKDES